MRIALLVTFAALHVACAKSDTPDSPWVSPFSNVSTTPSPSAPHTSASASAPSVTTITIDSGIACGAKGLPDCPLQAWMKANLGAASAKGDLAALASDFRTAVTFAPESEDKAYANWASIAKDGAAAASSGELQASRAACRSCHEQYRAKYKSEVRTRAL